jgi:ATP-dependent Clp protease adapter protein ClpS
MERNQAAGKALLEQFDKSTISDLNDFNETLWNAISKSSDTHFQLEIINNEKTPLEFIVKILVKIGFTCEDSVRLMMCMHKNGSIVLARAEESMLLSLQEYIKTQAKMHDCSLITKIKKL